MPGADKDRSVLRAWVEKAENDLKSAIVILSLEQKSPTDAVCFHAQQCAEKYFKALLVYVQIDFPRTHDLGSLIALMPEEYRPDLTIAEERTLSSYATVTRYPGDYDPVSLTEARRAVSLARRMRKHVRRLLPLSAIRKIHKRQS